MPEVAERVHEVGGAQDRRLAGDPRPLLGRRSVVHGQPAKALVESHAVPTLLGRRRLPRPRRPRTTASGPCSRGGQRFGSVVTMGTWRESENARSAISSAAGRQPRVVDRAFTKGTDAARRTGARMIYDHVVVGGGIVGASTARHLLGRRPGAQPPAPRQRAVVRRAPDRSQLRRHPLGHLLRSRAASRPRCAVAERGSPRSTPRRAVFPWTGSASSSSRPRPRELIGLDALRERAGVNRIEAELIDAAELRRREPHVTGLGALSSSPPVSPTSGRSTRPSPTTYGVATASCCTSTAVTGVRETADEVLLETTGGEVRARRVVFCAGVQSDRMARLAGIETDFRIIPFRGEYYDVVPEKADLVRHLIYPVPDPELPFLGVHLTRDSRRRPQRGPERRARPGPREVPEVLLRPARRPRHGAVPGHVAGG